MAWDGQVHHCGCPGFCCEPYWDSRNRRPSVASDKNLSPLSSYSSSHHLEVCFVHISGWCFYMQYWFLLIKLPDVFISSRVTNYITYLEVEGSEFFSCHLNNRIHDRHHCHIPITCDRAWCEVEFSTTFEKKAHMEDCVWSCKEPGCDKTRSCYFGLFLNLPILASQIFCKH